MLGSTAAVFLDVYADWCGPCRELAPTWAQLAELLEAIPEVTIAKMDSDTNDLDRARGREQLRLLCRSAIDRSASFQGLQMFAALARSRR